MPFWDKISLIFWKSKIVTQILYNNKIVFGIEKIHPKDSLHYPKSGLDPVLCKIAADRGKIIGFSFKRRISGIPARPPKVY